MSLKEENLIAYNGTLKKGQRLVKVGNSFMPVGVGGAFEPGSGSSSDTSAFESEMTAIIGEDANIPPVLVSGMKFYKCASVSTTQDNTSTVEKASYEVTGDTTDNSVNGIYNYIGEFYSDEMLCKVHIWEQESERYWLVEDPNGEYSPTLFITDYVDSLDKEAKTVITIGLPAVYYVPADQYVLLEANSAIAESDTISFTPLDATRPGISCTKVVPNTANKTWTGYELILTDGVYSVSETLTEGLTYVGFMPVVGGIYSADGMLELKDFYQGFQLVSPTNMTSNETDEWVITCSSYNHSPFNAFDGADKPTPGWWSADYTEPPHWITWQNKNRKSKIVSYSLQASNNEAVKDLTPNTWFLYGSNDGSDWVVVDERTNAISGAGNFDTFTFECQNPEFFYYYKLYVTEPLPLNYVNIGQIKAYGQLE